MNWLKEFIKPNKWKVGILVAVFAVEVDITFLKAQEFFNLMLQLRLNPVNYLILSFSDSFMGGHTPRLLLNLFVPSEYSLVSTPIHWDRILFWFIIWYLLSCLIYFIFSKIFRRKTSKE